MRNLHAIDLAPEIDGPDEYGTPTAAELIEHLNEDPDLRAAVAMGIRSPAEVLLLTQLRSILEGAREVWVDGEYLTTIRPDHAEVAHLLVRLDALLRGAP